MQGGMYGIISGEVTASPFSASATVENVRPGNNTFEQPYFGGQTSVDTGGGHVGGIGAWIANGTYGIQLLNGWFEEQIKDGGGGIGIQLGNVSDGAELVHAPIIKGNKFSGDTMTDGRAIKIVRVSSGEITSNATLVGSNYDYFFDVSAAGNWIGTAIFGNRKHAAGTWETGSYAAVLGLCDRVPTGASCNINNDATGSSFAVSGYLTADNLKTTRVEITNTQIRSLRASGKTLLAAPGNGYFYEIVSVVLILNYGSEILTESADDLIIRYITGATAITASIDATNFIDAAADTMLIAQPLNPIPAVAAANLNNSGVALVNTGDGEYGGNASNDTTMSVILTYRLHATGL